VLALMEIVAPHGQGKRGDFLGAFSACCREHTTCLSEETVVNSAQRWNYAAGGRQQPEEARGPATVHPVRVAGRPG
jgi:hypothetical protein